MNTWACVHTGAHITSHRPCSPPWGYNIHALKHSTPPYVPHVMQKVPSITSINHAYHQW